MLLSRLRNFMKNLDTFIHRYSDISVCILKKENKRKIRINNRIVFAKLNSRILLLIIKHLYFIVYERYAT